MGFCNDPDSHQALASPGQFLQFSVNYISLSTTSANIGHWQFASGKVNTLEGSLIQDKNKHHFLIKARFKNIELIVIYTETKL